MNARINASGILCLIFVFASAWYYEDVISHSSEINPVLSHIRDNKEKLLAATNEADIIALLDEITLDYGEIKDIVVDLYNDWILIKNFCLLNLTFLLSHFVTFLFTSKMKRFYTFPTINQFTDAILFGCSIVIIQFIDNNLSADVNADPNISEDDYAFILGQNFFSSTWFRFEYLFSVMIACLMFRIAIILQFNENIGPLIKIVGKMTKDFLNFFLLYATLTIMFALIGNINFVVEMALFKNFFTSILTVVDTSLGNYNFELFEKLSDPNLQIIGVFYTLFIVICFNILILNLIIAILANTYNIFDERSTGLYLSKILVSRDEMIYD